VEIGGLVSAGQTVLAIVSTLDPVYVNFSIPEADYVRFMRNAGSQQAATEQAKANRFQLILPDGSTYQYPGTFDFVERAISATGTLGDRVGPLWIVKSGLSPGERIVVEGMQKAPAGTRVAPTMITEAQLTRETAEGTVATPASPTPAPTGSQTKSPPK
jgi:membrane fusion protein (multidrug efflux system)